MEKEMYSLGRLKSMEVIEINSGIKLGFIKDFKVDCEECRIKSLLLPSQKMSWFTKNEDIEVPWESIFKVGADVILINYTQLPVGSED